MAIGHELNYTIGKGKLLFRPDGAAAAKGIGYHPLGNSPEVNLSTEIEKLDHYSSLAGLQLKDLSVVTKTGAMITFGLDEPNKDNLSKFFMSAEETLVSQDAEAAPANTTGLENVGSESLAALEGYLEDTPGPEIIVPTGGLGMWIPLYNAGITQANDAGKRCQDLVSLALYLSDDGTDMGAALVEGDYDNALANYKVDLDAGMILIHNDQSGCANPITANTSIFGFAQIAAVVDTAHNFAFTQTTLKGHLMFVGAPPQGQRIDIVGYCSLTPTGDFSLISDDWTQFQFEAEMLAHGDYVDASSRASLFQIINRGQVG